MIAKRDSYTAAIYCRLSQDDGQVGTSGSIETQKALLTQYCKDNGFTIGNLYCDDGWSGTNFERPQFKQMIEDIKDGKINLVVVKDLSRFGREYAQMGLYVEHYFEEKEVRFIAVSEGIDTINGTDNIIMPITNVMNSVYANVENYVKLIRQYTDLRELNTKVLNELIDRIVVHEKVFNPDGQKSQRVDIHYKFIGFVPVPMEALLAPPMPKMQITIEPDEQDVPA